VQSESVSEVQNRWTCSSRSMTFREGLYLCCSTYGRTFRKVIHD